MDPWDADGQVIYDRGVSLVETWQALEHLVDDGQCGAIGRSDIILDELRDILATSTPPRIIQENFDIATLPDDALREISKTSKTDIGFNMVVKTGGPGFIPRIA